MNTSTGLLIIFSIIFSPSFTSNGETREVGELPFCSDIDIELKRLVFVSTLDGKVSALNVDDGGSVKWTIPTGPGPMLSSSGIESRTYAVEASTGTILYECNMVKCDNINETKRGDIVLIKRQTQTVRAIEPRSGVESVGQHDVKLAPDPTTYCSSSQYSTDVFFKVIVPEGLICALSKSNPGVVLWKHKFEFPVVSAWQIEKGDLKWVDLFEGVRSPEDKVFLPESPLLYIGMHNKQLYIQESVRLQKKIIESSSKLHHHMITDESLPSIPWKPIAAGIEGPPEPLQITDETSQVSATAMSVLYASEYVNGKGFFLYGSLENEKNSNVLCSTDDDKVNITLNEEKDDDIFLSDDEEFPDDETPVQIIIVSFWYWWKEVMMMSLFMAVVVNIIIQRRLITFFFWVKHNQQIENSASTTDSAISIVTVNQVEFNSRYLADFEPVHCLGKGGFGIVFEAKNKIDDCHYAIKRIPLSNKEESSDRMKREVKALAKLDHQNIVRYFNSWVEEPPENWQEDQDKQWALNHNDILSSDVALDLSSQLTPTNENPGVRKRNTILNSIWNQASNYYVNSIERSVQKTHNMTTDSDSFIVFENSKSSKKEKSESIIFEEEKSIVSQYSKSKEPIRRPTSLFAKSTQNSPNLSLKKKYLYIQMQLCRRDSLKDWLSANQERCSSEVLRIFNQIVQAVEYVHFQGLIHRDLKPSNIFFSLDGQIKVGDFGLVTAMADDEEMLDSSGLSLTSRKSYGKHTARVGTQLYMSPEQVSGQQYDYKVDIYSLGVILFELLTNFKTEMERYKTLESVRMLKFPKKFDSNFPSEYELLKLMLSENPKMRPTTIGIRSREPLKKLQTEGTVHEDWHFQLPHRHREPSISRSSSDS